MTPNWWVLTALVILLATLTLAVIFGRGVHRLPPPNPRKRRHRQAPGRQLR